MNIVEIKNLNKTYENNKVLKNLNLKVKDKEFLMIIGKSGSGKSTLMHIIAGIELPDKGNVIINNTNLLTLKEKELTLFRRENIGLVFQSYNLLPNLNVEENILLPTYIAGRKRYKFIEIVKTLELKNKLSEMPYQLSGGGKQRVALARSLINNPKIILADEPTGNLDEKSSLEIMKLLKKCNQRGQTILMVTHDKELLKYATRVIRLEDGKVIENEGHYKNHKS